MNVEEVFRNYGNVWSPSGSDTAADVILSGVLKKCEYILAQLRSKYSIRSPVAAGLILDRQIQAVATKVGPGYAIGIHVGAIFHFYNLARSVLSSNKAFPAVIGSTRLKKYYPDDNVDMLESFETVPENKNTSRKYLSQTVFNYCISFLVFHEVAHITGGHTDIYASRAMFGLIEQPMMAVGGQDGAYERQCMEYYADIVSFLQIVSATVEDEILPVRRDFSNFSGPEFVTTQAASFAAFLIFATFSPHDISFNEEASAYPPSAVRLASLQLLAGRVFAKYGMPSAKALETLVLEPAGWAFEALSDIGFGDLADFNATIRSPDTVALIERIHKRTDAYIMNEFSSHSLVKIVPYG